MNQNAASLPDSGSLRVAHWQDVHVEQGFNARDFSSNKNQAHVNALKLSIAAQGITTPLVCRSDAAGKLFLIDGECRWRAIQQLMRGGTKNSATGKDLALLPFVIDNSLGPIERLARLIVHNTSCPLVDYEKATIIRRLLDVNWTQRQIAAYVGYSQSYVSKLAFLAAMPDDIFQAVRQGKLSARSVIDLQSDGSAVETIRNQLRSVRKGSRGGPGRVAKNPPASSEWIGVVQEIHKLCQEPRTDPHLSLTAIKSLAEQTLNLHGFMLEPGPHLRNVYRTQGPEFRWKFIFDQGPTHPIVVRATEAFAKIREESAGRIEIVACPHSLGRQPAMVSLLREGAIEMMAYSSSGLDHLVPSAGISGVGYAFKDAPTAWAAFDGKVGQLVRAAIMREGLFPLEHVWDSEFKNLSMASQPIRTVADVLHLKIGVHESKHHTDLISSMGGLPTPRLSGELPAACGARLFEGVECGVGSVVCFGWIPLMKYISLTAHRWNCYWTLINAARWQSLSPKLQDIVARNLGAATLAQRRDIVDLEKSAGDTLQRAGVIFNMPERAAFKAKLRTNGYYARWKREFGGKLWSSLETFADVA